MSDLWDKIDNSVPSFVVGAIVLLVVGWIIAVILSKIVAGALRHSGLDRRLARMLGHDTAGQGTDSAEVGGRVAFYIVMILVVMAVMDRLKLPIATQPLNSFLSGIFGYIPRLLGAAILVLLAWLIATILRTVVFQLFRTVHADERVGVKAESGSEPTTFSRSLSEIAYGLVFLLFLPMILDALQLPGLLVPVQRLLNTIFGFIPNLIAAALIVVIGWFVARFVARLVTNLLAAIGLDHFSERVGLAKALGEQKLSKLVGLLVYVLIIIPVIIAGLNALQLASITEPASHMLTQILNIVPKALAAGAIIGITYIIGRVVAGLVTSILAGFGFNRVPGRLGLQMSTDQAAGRWTASRVAGAVVLAAFLWFAVIEALQVLGLDQVTNLLSRLIVLAGHILLGLIIIAIGVLVARLFARAIRGSGTGQANLMAFTAEAATLVLFGAMGLRQMGLANEIINLGFGILLGTIGIAAAIAFGVGGRSIAGDQLERWIRGMNTPQLAGATSDGGSSSGQLGSGQASSSATSQTPPQSSEPKLPEDDPETPPDGGSGGQRRPPSAPTPGSSGGQAAAPTAGGSFSNEAIDASATGDDAAPRAMGLTGSAAAPASTFTRPAGGITMSPTGTSAESSTETSSALGSAATAETTSRTDAGPGTAAIQDSTSSDTSDREASEEPAVPGFRPSSHTPTGTSSAMSDIDAAPESSDRDTRAAQQESEPSSAATVSGDSTIASPINLTQTPPSDLVPEPTTDVEAGHDTAATMIPPASQTANGDAEAPSESVPASDSEPGVTGRSEDAGTPSGTSPAGAIEVKGTRRCPSSHPIKGNANSKIYHIPGERDYRATMPEICFSTEADAVAAGYRPIRRFGAQHASPYAAAAPATDAEATSGNGDGHQDTPGTEAGSASRGNVKTTGVHEETLGAISGTGSRDCPAGFPIKGNASSMIYHQPGGRYYNVTVPEMCFATEADAVAAGYRPFRHAGEG